MICLNEGWEKKSVRDILMKENYIFLLYIWSDECPICGMIHKYVDDEYSFEGTLSEFVEKMKDYDVLDLNMQVFYNKNEQIAYHIKQFHINGKPCPICEKYILN